MKTGFFMKVGIIPVVLCLFMGLSGSTAAVTKIKVPKEKKLALEWLNQTEIYEKFGKISDAIWSYAELGMQEFKSSKLLADTLEEAGFTVDRGAAGMPTCFVASYGSGKPVIGILGEYDALPMLSQKGRVPTQDPVVEGAPGHGCGHNTMCTAAAAAAMAVKEAMDKYRFQGTVKVFGSPAEETLISRPYMVKAGLFDEVDAVIDNHSTSGFGTSYGKLGNGLYSTIFTFKGKTAHGAAAWTAQSALDAVELMNVATNFLREHLFYTYRMHYVIVEGGEAPNVVPDKASVWYFIRNSDDRLEEMYRKVINCAKAAALATGTELADIRVISAIHQRNLNKGLAELIYSNIELVGMPEWTEEENSFAKALQKELGEPEVGMPTEIGKLVGPENFLMAGGSSDVGDVTRVVPTARLNFPGAVPGYIVHHWSCVASNFGSTAWKGLNAGAKVMAATAIDLMTQPKTLKKIQQEFEAYQKEHPYKSFLPEDAQPPLDLNRELMEKWRNKLEIDPNSQKSHALDPDFPLPLFWRFFTHTQSGDRVQAESVLKMLEQNHEKLSPVYRLLLNYAKASLHGKWADGYSSIRQASQLDKAWSYLYGRTSIIINRPGEAIAALEALDPERGGMRDWTPYWNQLTLAYHMLGDHKQELERARRARKQYPDDLSVLWYEARAWAALGKIEEVNKLIEESYNLPPSKEFNPGVIMLNAWMELKHQGHIGTSLELLERSINWHRDRPQKEAETQSYRYSLARVFYYSGMWEEAKSIFEALHGEQPENVRYYGWLGSTLARMHDKEGALKISKELEELDSPGLLGHHMFRCARIAAVLGEKEAAMEFLRKALAQGYTCTKLHPSSDFEKLWDYPPFQELVKPKG